MAAAAWSVWRRSARGPDGETYKLRFTGSEERARQKYAAIAEALRQGGVRLISPDNIVVLETSAPRLRTRW